MPRDDEGFREFVDARYVELLRIAYHLTGSVHEAEDLLQSALVKVLGRWGRIEDPVAYLRRVMVNHLSSVWRRHRVREVLTAILPERPVPDGTHGIAERQAVYAAMRGLPARTRAVIVLRYLADLPEAEVAATLGCSIGTVKSRASRGLARLREALDADPAPVVYPAADVELATGGRSDR